MASVQVTAIAAHKFRRSLALSLGMLLLFALRRVITFQKNRITAMVMRTASSETEQPTIEMISRASLCVLLSYILKNKK